MQHAGMLEDMDGRRVRVGDTVARDYDGQIHKGTVTAVDAYDNYILVRRRHDGAEGWVMPHGWKVQRSGFGRSEAGSV